MKTEFTKEYITLNKGCYSEKEVLSIKSINKDIITLEDLFNDLPIGDFTWFLVRKCDLTIDQNKRFALHCAKQVLLIYEKEHPNDTRVRECIEFTEKYINEECTLDELKEKRLAANAAAANAAANAAAYAAAAAAASAAASAAAYAYASAAAYAYASADDDVYKQSIWKFIQTQLNI